MWRCLFELYGQPFITIYGEEPTPLWLAGIAELTDAECHAGLMRLIHEPREFPVNLTQFIGTCRPRLPGPRFLGAPVRPDDPALDPPRASREHIDACLKRIRARLA